MNSPDAPALSFRQAGEPDAALLEVLAREIWTTHYTPIIGAAQVEYMLTQFQSESAIRRDLQNGYVYDIAFSGDTPCGYCAVRDDGNTHFLSKLYVHRDFRGRGIARALVGRAANRARQAGALSLRLTCNKRNPDSLAAYAHMGFRVAGECVTPIGGGFVMDDYILVMDL